MGHPDDNFSVNSVKSDRNNDFVRNVGFGD